MRYTTIQPARLARIASFALVVAATLIASAAFAEAWPVSSSASTEFNCFDQDYFEPSGSTRQGDWLYVVSDNGLIGRQKQGDDQDCEHRSGSNHFDSQPLITGSKEGDFESLAAVPGKTTLYLGVEGNAGTVPNAKIIEYQPPADRLTQANAPSTLTGNSWTLTTLPVQDGDGMEAMTFVPDGEHPYTQAGAPFNGLFYVASQASKGTIYVFELGNSGSGDSGSVSQVATFTKPLLSASPSDLYFSPEDQRLYVLYDEGSHRLQVLKVLGGGYVQEAIYAPQFGTTKTNAQMKGMEAVTTSAGGDLYIGLDQSRGQAADNGSCRETSDDHCTDWLNPIYRYANFVPAPVLSTQ
ncbi:MAG: hypothetical protein AAF657_01965 [Acidobacteriota bacterium]